MTNIYILYIVYKQDKHTMPIRQIHSRIVHIFTARKKETDKKDGGNKKCVRPKR